MCLILLNIRSARTEPQLPKIQEVVANNTIFPKKQRMGPHCPTSEETLLKLTSREPQVTEYTGGGSL